MKLAWNVCNHEIKILYCAKNQQMCKQETQKKDAPENLRGFLMWERETYLLQSAF